MKENNSLALIVAYYLSKFDKTAYQNLGFGTSKKTHEEIGKVLDVNPNSVKNMRDEFDPIHENPRAGWYQRPLRPSRKKVLESFQHLDEEELRDVVLSILNNNDLNSNQDFAGIVSNISKIESNKNSSSTYAVRGPTGRKA